MTKEEAKKILTEYVKACREDDMFTLEQFVYEEVIEAMSMGAEALSVLPGSSNLEEAADKYLDKLFGKGKHQPFYKDLFVTGAKLQKEQDDKLVDIIYQQGIEKGKDDMKEQMLNKAVDADIMLTLHDKTGDVSLHTGYLPKELGIKCDDKVRIIIVKEDSHE